MPLPDDSCIFLKLARSLEDKQRIQIHLANLDLLQKQDPTEDLTFFVGEYMFTVIQSKSLALSLSGAIFQKLPRKPSIVSRLPNLLRVSAHELA